MAGWIAVGVGGAALSVGSLVGVVVLGEEQSLLDRCADRQCLPDAHDDAQQFDTLRAVSTVGFIAGGVGVAAGVALLLLAPSGSEPEPEDDPDGADGPGLDSLAMGPCPAGLGPCLTGAF